MRRAIIGLAFGLLLLTTGCLGSVSPAEIPEEHTSSSAWQESERNDGSLVAGLGDLVTITYNKGGSIDALGIKVATLNDLPIIDEEKRLVPLAIEQVEKEEGIEFEQRGPVDLRLVNLESTVTATEYNIRGAGVPAKAVLFAPACDDFVVVVAYGPTTDTGGGGLFGGGGGDTLYQEARDLSRRVVCG